MPSMLFPVRQMKQSSKSSHSAKPCMSIVRYVPFLTCDIFCSKPYIMAEADLPQKAGPQSLDEFCQWPYAILQKLLCARDGSDGERLNRLRALLDRGLWVDSEYSGLAGEHEVLHQLTQALKLFAPEYDVPSFADVNVVHGHFCDKGKVQQEILSYISGMYGNSICVLDDLNDRLPTEARSLLDSLYDEDGKVSAEEAESAYKEMLDWLLDNRSWVFSPTATSHCMIHGKQCRLVPSEDGEDLSGPSAKRLKTSRKLFCTDSETETRSAAGAGSGTLCRSNMLRLNLAGTTCTGWSSVGKKLQYADPSERPHAIWSVERLSRAEASLEDVVISECTPRYPVQARLNFFV